MSNFTEDEIKLLRAAARQTYCTIAPDCPGSGPRDRDTVFELTVDADRMRQFCSPEQEVVVEKFYRLGWVAMLAMKETLFPHASYE